jgi:hypothetical protein
MNDPKFTPKLKWHAFKQQEHSGRDSGWRVEDENDVTICHVYEPAEEKARFIAYAPELYAENERLKAALNVSCDSDIADCWKLIDHGIMIGKESCSEEIDRLKSIVRKQTEALKMVAVNYYLGVCDHNKVEYALKLGEGV